MVNVMRGRGALKLALANYSLPLEERWALANQQQMPTDEWHSFDRTPWRHPWMTSDNIRQFARYSTNELDRLARQVSRHGLWEKVRGKRRFAFVGNMANINYVRASPLRRRGVAVDLFLSPTDNFIFAQPAWEDFDGEITELGNNPTETLARATLPPWVYRLGLDANWPSTVAQNAPKPATPERILVWPEYMGFLPTLTELSKYDSLLVSQYPHFGFLSGRPYLFGQIGGEIWFEAARNDAIGIMVRRSIENAYAVLVSNPITLAHARRYNLRNVLYVPLPLDEQTYCPGDSREIRAEWQRNIGGSFFVLTSMRIDRHWKGAQHALEGFARFAAQAPEARLVVLGWGDDLESAKARLSELGIADRVAFLPTVGKKRLVRYLQAADVVIEQFVLGYYGTSGLEAMACGTPVIMRLEREQYDSLIDAGAPPILHAENGQEVEQQLYRLYTNSELARDTGQRTRDWFLAAHSSLRWWTTYEMLLKAMALGIPLSTRNSPLLQPLSSAENDYHSRQLAQAPPFPHYVDP